MEKYNYEDAITQDVKDWIINETDILTNRDAYGTDYELIDWIEDEVWGDDSVTGNGDFCYAGEDECSMFLAGNSDLLYEALDSLGTTAPSLIEHYYDHSMYQYFDTTIRCYLLVPCIERAIEELKI